MRLDPWAWYQRFVDRRDRPPVRPWGRIPGLARCDEGHRHCTLSEDPDKRCSREVFAAIRCESCADCDRAADWHFDNYCATCHGCDECGGTGITPRPTTEARAS